MDRDLLWSGTVVLACTAIIILAMLYCAWFGAPGT